MKKLKPRVPGGKKKKAAKKARKAVSVEWCSQIDYAACSSMLQHLVGVQATQLEHARLPTNRC